MNDDSIVKLLEAIKKIQDDKDPNVSNIYSEEIGLSQEKWTRLIKQMQEKGLIKGFSPIKTKSLKTFESFKAVDPKLTKTGKKYLENNND